MTDLHFSRKTLISKKDKQLSFSFSNENIMLGCLEDKYYLNFSGWSSERKTIQIYHQYTIYRRQISNYEGNL